MTKPELEQTVAASRLEIARKEPIATKADLADITSPLDVDDYRIRMEERFLFSLLAWAVFAVCVLLALVIILHEAKGG